MAAEQRERQQDGDDETPGPVRESYGWLASSAVPAKKRRLIEGAPPQRRLAAEREGGRAVAPHAPVLLMMPQLQGAVRPLWGHSGRPEA
jgi:hypothetical protein